MMPPSDLGKIKQSNFSALRNNFIFKYYSLFMYNIMIMYQYHGNQPLRTNKNVKETNRYQFQGDCL